MPNMLTQGAVIVSPGMQRFAMGYYGIDDEKLKSSPNLMNQWGTTNPETNENLTGNSLIPEQLKMAWRRVYNTKNGKTSKDPKYTERFGVNLFDNQKESRTKKTE